jgi:hypothetical protein
METAIYTYIFTAVTFFFKPLSIEVIAIMYKSIPYGTEGSEFESR